jgi:hypothetical protein
MHRRSNAARLSPRAVKPGQPGSPFFFVAFFFGETRARGWPERLAVIVDRHSLDVKRYRTPPGLALDDGQHRTPRDTGTKPETAPARQSCLAEAFQRRVSSITHGSGVPRDGNSPDSHPRGNHTPTEVAPVRFASREETTQSSALMSRSTCSFVASPMCFLHSVPSRPM